MTPVARLWTAQIVSSLIAYRLLNAYLVSLEDYADFFPPELVYSKQGRL